MTGFRTILLGCVVCAASAGSAWGQHPQPAWRFAADSQVSVTTQGRDSAATGLVIDSFLAAQLRDAVQVVARPVSRGSVNGSWHHDFYQLGVRYQPERARLPLRIEAGYMLSVVGLGVHRTRPVERFTVSMHPQYLRPLPAFERGLPPVWSVTPSYPLVAIASFGTEHWDARLGVADGSPTRMRGVLRDNPPRAAQLVLGGGVRPVTGLRLGATFVTGSYLQAGELPAPGAGDRRATVSALELEYEFNHTSVAAEWIWNDFQTRVGHAMASSGFVRVGHALSPRWRAGGRFDVTTPPGASRVLNPAVRPLRSSEGLLAYRLTRDFVLRGFVVAERSFYDLTWRREAGVSVVVVGRWW